MIFSFHQGNSKSFRFVQICIHIGMELCVSTEKFLCWDVPLFYSHACWLHCWGILLNHLKALRRGQTTISLENVFIAGYFPLQSEHCLVWICLDVLFCTASIMHLCTISIDRYLSLRYPMRFGRNKTRKRVILKIFFVWLLSIAMSLPLSLMYSKVNFIRHKRLAMRLKISINLFRIMLRCSLMELVKFLIRSTSLSDRLCVFIFRCLWCYWHTH